MHGEIQTVAWAKMNSHFKHLFTNRLAVAEMPVFKPINARLNEMFCPLVSKL